MDEQHIRNLLAAFYQGDTNVEEEKQLVTFFQQKNLSPEWDTDRTLFLALYDAADIPIPQGLSARLEDTIHSFEATNPLETRTFGTTRRLYLRIASVAASLLLCIGLYVSYTQSVRTMPDTYNNPEEAAVMAEETLAYVSEQLNKGLKPIATANENIDKAQQTIDKFFNIKIQ